MKITLSRTSKLNLSAGLDYRLSHILMEALQLEYSRDWGIYETKRTKEQQQINIKNGASKTMNSKHIPNSLGIVMAFDIVPWIPPYGWSWDGKLLIGGANADKARATKECFDEVIGILKKLANKYYPGQITFGEDWKTLVDRPHVEITTGQEIK